MNESYHDSNSLFSQSWLLLVYENVCIISEHFKDIKCVEIYMGVSFSVSAKAKPKIFPFRI